MFFYFIYIILIIFLFGEYKINRKPKSKYLYLLGILFFVFILIFRFDVGYDYPHYYRALYPQFDEHAVNRWEPVCQLFAYTSYYFRYPPLFFIISGLLTCYFVFRSLAKYTNNILLAVLTFVSLYFEATFGYVRQGLALSVILWGYPYLIKNQWKKYIILCLFAASIHYSALICLIFPFLYKYVSSLFRVALVLTAIVFCYKVVLIGLSEQFSLYESYINGEHAVEGGRLIRFSNILILLILYIFAHNKPENDINKRLIRIGLIGCIFPFLLGGHLGGRLAWYFMIYICIATPNILAQYRQKIIPRCWGIGLISLYFLMLYVSNNNTTKSPYLPYQTIFSANLEHPAFK